MISRKSLARHVSLQVKAIQDDLRRYKRDVESYTPRSEKEKSQLALDLRDVDKAYTLLRNTRSLLVPSGMSEAIDNDDDVSDNETATVEKPAPINVRLIVANLKGVFTRSDISRLKESAYQFLVYNVGLDAYTDRIGFASHFRDVRKLAAAILSGEKSSQSLDDLISNREKDEDWREKFGDEYAKSVLETMKQIREIASKVEAPVQAAAGRKRMAA